MSTEIIEYIPRQMSIRATAAQFLGVPPDKACDLLRNVWQTSKGQPPLTDAEMFCGMSMIARFGLDPIAREIYVTRTSKGLVTIVGLDGWIKILDRTEGYDGFEQNIIQDAKGEIVAVETKIHSTRRSHPTCYMAFASEYKKVAGIVAQSLPSHMLRIFSLRHAARLFTPIGGSVVTEEEARWMDAYADTPEESRPKALKDKIAKAAKEFEPIKQPEQIEQEPPFDPPTADEVKQHTEPDPIKQDAAQDAYSDLWQEYQERIDMCTGQDAAYSLVDAAFADPKVQELPAKQKASLEAAVIACRSKWQKKKS